MSVVLLPEVCYRCGHEVPRKLIVTDDEPKLAVLQVVRCPRCKVEQPTTAIADIHPCPKCYGTAVDLEDLTSPCPHCGGTG